MTIECTIELLRRIRVDSLHFWDDSCKPSFFFDKLLYNNGGEKAPDFTFMLISDRDILVLWL